MAMGKRARERQDSLFIPSASLAQSPGHPFYRKLNRILANNRFDDFAEEKCRGFYAEEKGRPSVPPGVYFRMLMVGYFENLDSERGIAWKVTDSLSLREFLGYSLEEETPDHSSLSRIRQRLPLEVHAEIFTWVLRVLAKEKLLKGKTVGVDATTLEASAAMKSIVCRDTGESYPEFITRLAEASGIETPTLEDIRKFDRKRKKKASNDDWTSPTDPDARITKMKDGRTHLAHKAEHVVDLETQALLSVTLPHADEGDTETLVWSLIQADMNLKDVAAEKAAWANVYEEPLLEVVADKGYHSNDVLKTLVGAGVRTYISEPDRGRRDWKGDTEAQSAVYANRRRIKGHRGAALRRLRAEIPERSFAHLYETGAMRRTHLRGSDNILKRLLIHACGYNLGLVMRKLFGVGTPKGLADLLKEFLRLLSFLRSTMCPMKSVMHIIKTKVDALLGIRPQLLNTLA